MDRIPESSLILPTLYLLYTYGELDTSALITGLRNLLRPTGEDIEILANRSDDKFSQKVRNLRSHRTLSRPGLVKELKSGSGNKITYRITSKGRNLYLKNKENLNTLIAFGIEKLSKELSEIAEGSDVIILDEFEMEQASPVSGELVVEGQVREVVQKRRDRSSTLRREALKYYSEGGRIHCAICEFEFDQAYSKIGKGYIELHHIRPIYALADKELNMRLAIENIRPLCSNCHRMVHSRVPPLSIRKVQNALRVTYKYRKR